MSIKVLLVQSSARGDGSTSRKLALAAVDHIKASGKEVTVVERDVGLNPLTPITGEWIGSVFTPADNLTPEQKALIEVSDACVAEVEAADVIVLGVATYNFNISASLKLWIDYIARQGKTFQYGANGPEGLLKNKRVVVCRASGGTAEDAPINFATPYLTWMMKFIGITDVSFFSATTMGELAEANYEAAVAEVKKLEF